MRIDIRKPGKEPGKEGAIVFTTLQRGRAAKDDTDDLFKGSDDDLMVSLPDITPLHSRPSVKRKTQEEESSFINYEAVSGFRID
jgi:hypothetical protein